MKPESLGYLQGGCTPSSRPAHPYSKKQQVYSTVCLAKHHHQYGTILSLQQIFIVYSKKCTQAILTQTQIPEIPSERGNGKRLCQLFNQYLDAELSVSPLIRWGGGGESQAESS